MSKSKRQFKKLKDREKQSKGRVLKKRAVLRESEALKKELAELIKGIEKKREQESDTTTIGDFDEH